MRSFIYSISLILSISLSLTSCNFLVSPMHGRENSNDFDAQIYSLFAYQTLADEVQVSFPWRNKIYNYDDEDQIEETFLVYSIGKAIPARNVPVPPSVGGIEGYAFTDTVYMYSKTIEGVSEGDEIWFALYPKMGNRWLAPLYEKITVRDPVDIPVITDGPIYPARGYQGEENGGIGEVTDYDIDANIDPSLFLILEFDLPYFINITNAILNFPNGTGTGTIYPLTISSTDRVGGSEIEQYIDMNHAVDVDFTSISGGVDITSVMHSAAIYQSNMIVIKADSGVTAYTSEPWNDNDEFLTITYEQY